jgi:uncharacterized membrane protein HdeD (DUF308 family)
MSTDPLPGANRFLLMGLALTLFGVAAIASPAVAGTAVVYVIGGLLLIAGALEIVGALRSEGWSHKVVPLLIGVLTVLAGIGILAHPLFGLAFLALVVAVFFVVTGVWKMYASFSFRPATGWLAMLISGALALVLGALIWLQWPLSGLWAVGVLVGVDLLSTGAALICLSFTIRAANRLARATVPT